MVLSTKNQEIQAVLLLTSCTKFEAGRGSVKYIPLRADRKPSFLLYRYEKMNAFQNSD